MVKTWVLDKEDREGPVELPTSVPGSDSAQEGHGLPGNTPQHDVYGGSH